MGHCNQPTITPAGIRSLGSTIKYIDVSGCSDEVINAALEFSEARVVAMEDYNNGD
jgi:hypothetical protein